jgi:hypothetical protein
MSLICLGIHRKYKGFKKYLQKVVDLGLNIGAIMEALAVLVLMQDEVKR